MAFSRQKVVSIVRFVLGAVACVILAVASLSLPRLYLSWKYNIQFKFWHIFTTKLSKLPEIDRVICRILYLLIPALVLAVEIVAAIRR